MIRTRTEMGFRRWAAELFDQQMWCLGRDVVHPRGNILLSLGMCRYRAPNSLRGGTLYTAAVEPGGSLFLWGFGALYTEAGRGGVFIRRYDFAPSLTVRESGLGAHEADDLRPLTKPTSPRDWQTLRHLLSGLVGWFAKYEHWIAEKYGTAYRNECLASRDKPSPVPAQHMAKEWERAAKKCHTYRLAPTPSANPWQTVLNQLRTPTLRMNPLRPSTRVAR
jgi:hypothetical protein